jgi:hypothetical protein
MAGQKEDRWFVVGVGTILATLLLSIGLPSLPPPVKVPRQKTSCLLVFDSPPLSSRFDVTINGRSKGTGLVEKVLEDVSWGTTQTMLLEFAAFQTIARKNFHPITKPVAALNEQPLLNGFMYFASDDQKTVIRVKGTKAELLSGKDIWRDVSKDYKIPQNLEQLRPLITKGLWHTFTNSPEHLEASVALSAKRTVRITILARNDVSLNCST